VEQYLDMTDEDIEFMVAYNIGNYAGSPFYASCITSKERPVREEDEIDKSMDYIPESEEILVHSRTLELLDDFPEDPSAEDFETD